mgnify:CR=1 FL=1
MNKLQLIGLLIALALYPVMYMVGRTDGKKICIGSAAVTYQEGVKNDAQIEKGVQRMAEPDLDRALSKWVR